ncbi:hypothetical protein VHUM_02670 [Vanrija humicola]|uniref:NAD-dependent epimerase/dehydratase domain-containing protein n=1 Tax=Vanrija humicola TaxID=5417 RepID=A0A7D8V1P6_VANHU|nr:hypothetical protein VHUM_02670 [Vanrija humicola]
MIGKHLVRRLLRASVPVTVLDVIFFEDELEQIRDAYPTSDLRIVHGDIRDDGKLAEAMDGVSGVVHLAAVSRVLWCLENLDDCNDVNVRGTEKVLNAVPDHGWFIQASSREVYGDPEILPVVEDTPHNPANVYGRSKASAEDVITRHVNAMTRTKAKKLNAIMLRLSNVYGAVEGHHERLVPAIMNNALSNRPIQMVGGDQNLDMVHVNDVVDAFSLAITRLDRQRTSWMRKRHGSVEVFNIGTDHSTTATELIRKTLWLTNSSSPLRVIPGDDRFPSHYVGSTVKASKELGYAARVSIDAGLHQLASDTLSETVAFLARRQREAPFYCDRTKHYTTADVLKLDGCRVSLALKGDKGNIMYNEHLRANKDRNTTNQWEHFSEVSVWDMAARREGDEVLVSFSLDDEYRPNNDAKAELVKEHVVLHIPEREPGADDSFTEFRVRVQPDTGYVHLTAPDGTPLWLSRRWPKPARRGLVARQDTDTELYNMRLTPVCCAGKKAPWPFFKDDPLPSALLDTRYAAQHDFNASQIAVQCSRFAAAEAHARRRLATLEAFSTPIVLQQAPLPLGRPQDWRQRRNKDICSVQCGHPTFCVDTGDCLCTHTAQCSPRARFPFGAVANTKLFSYPSPSVTPNPDTVLVDNVARMSWANVINPDARRYFTSKPEWPLMTTVRNPDEMEVIKNSTEHEFYVLGNSRMGCFSADGAMERSAQLISKPFKEGESLVFVPYFSVNDWMTVSGRWWGAIVAV